MDAEAAVAMQRTCGKFQPELTAFFIASVQDLRPDAASLGLYAMVVVFEMFRATGAKIRKATDKSVMKHWRRSAELAAQLESSGLHPSNLSAASFSTEEPHVAQYVIEALREMPEDDPVELTQREFWHLFVSLITLVHTLRDNGSG